MTEKSKTNARSYRQFPPLNGHSIEHGPQHNGNAPLPPGVSNDTKER